ncbi:tRNA (adenosine(37)-N6)-threonylcarbamoyltransferase complex dimerization subunit type 1 TsaB [Thalassotalea ponticola]|uniref:tRNA (adenosine(37)-N6)-threonylcarbamoyltransferase complex dimerization subunit type 1 TsaB n=1 Tax=Thalassotalea ponticola TaxID=1523392 RepID=UPI0025B566A1|nr:tRNA (adenosine(37)-N6)-threonylcarbamoyltransferase complex dimerization subunit type 1 TsaB [Thalassotalea ponticola]MDN3651297.1 tRNA (adenosine(37)-N6)-threonylcarbamoyltransferase complex dimerization subunit type 1 TsaB [Thalassotalea ponticola]
MNYLAIDASTEAASVAVSVNDRVYHRFELCPQSHSLLLLPMVDDVLKQAGIKVADLDGLIFGRGPGSFTGVRIGIGVAQGLAFSADLPVVGISTLQAMAQQAYDNFGHPLVLSAIDARMSEAYVGLFQVDDNQLMQPLLDEAVMAPSRVGDYVNQLTTTLPLHGAGSAWSAYNEAFAELADIDVDDSVRFPHALAMLKLGKQAFAQGKGVDAENAQPVYVRDTVTWKKLPGRE